jgi:hypothetical protein
LEISPWTSGLTASRFAFCMILSAITVLFR